MKKRLLCLLLMLCVLCAPGIPVLATMGDSGFSDVPPGAWYAEAVGWATAEGIISGYGDGRFGPDDPVTREQLATILWRTAGSPAPAGTSAFADQRGISSFAVSAVAWAWEQGIAGGKGGNRFDPQGTTTRAELAVMLHRRLSNDTPAPSETPGTGSTTLVAYFSCTGSTKAIAETLAEHLNADRYAITPAEPYASADLNYSDSTSRSAREQSDPAAHPTLGGSTLDLADYDRVYLGYPIWFGQAPKLISTFLERYDFSDKTIIPFCTSGSSGMGSSADSLRRLVPDATWLSGRRFERNVSADTVISWADRLFQQEKPAIQVLTVQVGSRSFTATLEDNETTRAFVAGLPMTVTMGELNGNEKFYYLPSRLPTDSHSPGTIHTGDLMLYGSDCLVLFYESFSSGYRYTRLGSLDDPTGLADALGGGSVEVTFLADG